MRYTGACYRQLGVPELADLVDAVDWLTAEPWADASRVGITGYSYGGFMSAYALLASDRFALGIAGGGVYDWGMYDTIYTERYMSTPQDNPDGYVAGSPISYAENLRGNLLLIHGTGDDNVHYQGTEALIDRLIASNKHFTMMSYPMRSHGIFEGRGTRLHLFNLLTRYLNEHVPAGAR